MTMRQLRWYSQTHLYRGMSRAALEYSSGIISHFWIRSAISVPIRAIGHSPMIGCLWPSLSPASSRLTQRQKFRSESRICPRLKTLTELLWMTRRFHRQSAQRCSALRFGTMCSPLKSSIRDTPGIHPSTADSSATFQEK